MSNIFNKIITFLGGIIILFLIILIILISNVNKNLNNKILQLENEIDSLDSSMFFLKSSLSSQISQLQFEIENKNRIYYNNGYDIINYNPDNDIVTINYFLNLKNYDSSDKVFLVYKNGIDINKVEMTENNSYFKINIDIESKKTYDISVIVEGQKIETQSIDNLQIYESLLNRINIYHPYVIGIRYVGSEDITNGIMGFSFSNNYGDDNKLKIISGKVTASFDNKQILNIDNISTLIIDNKNYQSVNIEEDFPLSNNSKFEDIKEEGVTYTVELNDSYGFTYYWSSPLM